MSGFLLDTNIISELVKPRPERVVTKWIDATDENLLCLSVLTFGEIRKGIASPRRRGDVVRPPGRSSVCRPNSVH